MALHCTSRRGPSSGQALPSVYMWSRASLLLSWPLFPHLCKGLGQVTPKVTSVASILGLYDYVGCKLLGELPRSDQTLVLHSETEKTGIGWQVTVFISKGNLRKRVALGGGKMNDLH